MAVGQYCFYVTDLERCIAFYELLGLDCTSRTDIPGHAEAIPENPNQGSKRQLAQQVDNDASIDMGPSMWKLYAHTDACEPPHQKAVAAGYNSLVEPMSPERWTLTTSFLADPDGYQVELVERHPGPTREPSSASTGDQGELWGDASSRARRMTSAIGMPSDAVTWSMR